MKLFDNLKRRKDSIKISNIKGSTITLKINDIEAIENFLESNNQNIVEDVKREILEILFNEREKAYKILKPYEEVMQLNSDYQDVIDFPILNDIENENSLVFFDKISIQKIDFLTSSKNIRRFLLKGAGGRGKTVLSRLYAYKKKQKGWDILFLDVREISILNLKEIQKETTEKLNHQKETLIIVENSHISDTITDKLVRQANEFIHNYPNVYFLFLSRDYPKDEDVNPFSEWKVKKWFLELKPDNDLINSIIQKFINYHSLKYSLSIEDREWIENFILKRKSKNKSRVNGDLRLLRLFLASWKFEEKGLYELTEKDILTRLKQHYYINELSREEGLVEVLSTVTSIFQFDVPFYAKRTKIKDTVFLVEYLDKLRRRGLVRFIGQSKYVLSHSLDAYYLNKCLSSLQQEENELFTAQNVVQYFNELPKFPKERISENIFGIFKGFFGTNPKGFDGLKVYEFVYNEAHDLIFKSLVYFHVGIFTYSIQYINRTKGQEEAAKFLEFISKNYDDRFWHNRIEETDALTSSILCMNIGKIDEQKAALFFNKYLRHNKTHSQFLGGGNLITLQHFIRNLPSETVETIIPEISKEKFAEGLAQTKSFTNSNFLLAKISLSEIGKRFLKDVFLIVQEFHFEEYKEQILSANSYITVQRVREFLNSFGANSLRKALEQDPKVITHLDKIRQDSIKTNIETGRKIIKKKIIKGLLHLKSKRKLLDFLIDNILNSDFEINFNSPIVISRLVNKIYLTLREERSKRLKQIGIDSVRKIITNLKYNPEFYHDAFMYEPLLQNIRMLDEKLFQDVGEEYKDFTMNN